VNALLAPIQEAAASLRDLVALAREALGRLSARPPAHVCIRPLSYTVEEAALMLGVSETTLRRRVKAGLIRSYLDGADLRIPLVAMEAYVQFQLDVIERGRRAAQRSRAS
jgi:excisionase family DNA binding protein